MSEFERAQYLEYLKKAQEAGLNVGAQQQSLADALLARSEGRGGPSVAELQLQRTLSQNQQALAGEIAGAGRSINPALARTLLIQQQAKAAQQAAGEGALLRAKEQAEAQNSLASQLTAMRTAEQNATQTAGSLGLQQEKLGVETQEAQKQREFDAAKANQEASLAYEKNKTDNARNSRKDFGSFLTEAGRVASLFNRGGMVTNYAGGGKINAAMGKLTKMDNEKNDTVPAMLSPGEIVLPRSIVSAPNAPTAAARFVEALLANKDKKDAKVMALKAALGKK
jgi:hypothetical protein